MTLRVTFELSDKDLKHFRKEMRRVKAVAKNKTELEVIEGADDLLTEVRKRNVPEFVTEWLDKLATLIAMLTDREWDLPKRERDRVRSALCYFSDPQDLIHDDIPGLGFLDDAIMVKLLVRELRHEIDAYEDFCHFRQDGYKHSPKKFNETSLLKRKVQLHERIRRRKSRRGKDGRGSAPPVGFWT